MRVGRTPAARMVRALRDGDEENARRGLTSNLIDGGGEPLQFAGLFDVLRELDGSLFRSVTTNGLLLHGETLNQLVAARPDKVHVSIHFPDRAHEVNRVAAQVTDLAHRGVKSGANF